MAERISTAVNRNYTAHVSLCNQRHVRQNLHHDRMRYNAASNTSNDHSNAPRLHDARESNKTSINITSHIKTPNTTHKFRTTTERQTAGNTVTTTMCNVYRRIFNTQKVNEMFKKSSGQTENKYKSTASKKTAYLYHQISKTVTLINVDYFKVSGLQWFYN